MSIGILDSGVGGLTVWGEMVTLLPTVSTIYVGDSKNCPYGTKTEEEIWKLTQKLVQFLLTQNVSLIVIACNTISVITLERLRVTYPDMLFIGTVPAIKLAVAESKKRRIGILSTPRTAESAYQQALIKQFAIDCEVLNLGTDRLVPLVEQGELVGDRATQVLKEVVQPFIEKEVDTLVLGCTHFPFLKEPMQSLLGSEVRILDSGQAIARQVKRVLEEKQIPTDLSGKHRFFTSGEREQMHRLLQTLDDSVTIQDIQSL